MADLDRMEALERVLYWDDKTEKGAGLIPALEWALCRLKEYHTKETELWGGVDMRTVNPTYAAAMDKACKDLEAAKRVLGDRFLLSHQSGSGKKRMASWTHVEFRLIHLLSCAAGDTDLATVKEKASIFIEALRRQVETTINKETTNE